MTKAQFICHDCGRDARVHVFIAEPYWNMIKPSHDGQGGVLCLYCMSARLERYGVDVGGVPGTITEGPLSRYQWGKLGEGRAPCSCCGGSGVEIEQPETPDARAEDRPAQA